MNTRRSTVRRAVLVGGTCAVVGAAGGIAGTAASPKHKSSSARATRHGQARPGFPGRHGPFGGPAVHATAVVLNKAGDGFVTVTTDSGKVKSVSGDQLTITEAVGTVTYKDDVTLTVPSGATVQRNFAAAQLSDLKAGDFVHVASSSEGTEVFAVDPNAQPPRGEGMEHGDRRGEAPGTSGGPPGGPPGAWQ